MKEFDFEEALKSHRPEVVKWLKSIYKKRVTLEEYAEGYRCFRATDIRPYKSSRYCPSRMKKNYDTLVLDFGFFL